MTQRDLNEEWAWTQLEAWADGTLTGDSRARMDAAIGADPLLAAAAERAVAVQRALRETHSAPLPRGLRSGLLAIPSRAPRARRSYFIPALASAVVAAAVVAIGVSLRPATPPQVDPQVVAAAENFETAMRYLQKSAVITQGHVESAIGAGLRDAFAASRNALAKDTKETGG